MRVTSVLNRGVEALMGGECSVDALAPADDELTPDPDSNLHQEEMKGVLTLRDHSSVSQRAGYWLWSEGAPSGVPPCDHLNSQHLVF